MLDVARGEELRRLGLEFYCWDIETRQEALAAIDRGASGLISHHLNVFRDLAGRRTVAS
jgi:hypothetical protein